MHNISLLDQRNKDLDSTRFSYKLAGAGNQYGMDVAMSDNLGVDEAKMSLRFPYADGNRRDGVGDLLEVGGINLERHQKNKVVLFDHGKAVTLPIGMAMEWDSLKGCYDTSTYTVDLDLINKQAWVNNFFYQGKGIPGADSKDEYDHALFCHQLFHMAACKMLGCGSIGYSVTKGYPLQADYNTGTPQGLHLLNVLQLECSLVVMPANMDTVTTAKSMDIARHILSLPKVCGKPLAAPLVKSLTPYVGENKAQLGWEPGRVESKANVPEDEVRPGHGSSRYRVETSPGGHVAQVIANADDVVRDQLIRPGGGLTQEERAVRAVNNPNYLSVNAAEDSQGEKSHPHDRSNFVIDRDGNDFVVVGRSGAVYGRHPDPDRAHEHVSRLKKAGKGLREVEQRRAKITVRRATGEDRQHMEDIGLPDSEQRVVADIVRNTADDPNKPVSAYPYQGSLGWVVPHLVDTQEISPGGGHTTTVENRLYDEEEVKCLTAQLNQGTKANIRIRRRPAEKTERDIAATRGNDPGVPRDVIEAAHYVPGYEAPVGSGYDPNRYGNLAYPVSGVVSQERLGELRDVLEGHGHQVSIDDQLNQDDAKHLTAQLNKALTPHEEEQRRLDQEREQVETDDMVDPTWEPEGARRFFARPELHPSGVSDTEEVTDEQGNTTRRPVPYGYVVADREIENDPGAETNHHLFGSQMDTIEGGINTSREQADTAAAYHNQIHEREQGKAFIPATGKTETSPVPLDSVQYYHNIPGPKQRVGNWVQLVKKYKAVQKEVADTALYDTRGQLPDDQRDNTRIHVYEHTNQEPLIDYMDTADAVSDAVVNRTGVGVRQTDTNASRRNQRTRTQQQQRQMEHAQRRAAELNAAELNQQEEKSQRRPTGHEEDYQPSPRQLFRATGTSSGQVTSDLDKTQADTYGHQRMFGERLFDVEEQKAVRSDPTEHAPRGVRPLSEDNPEGPHVTTFADEGGAGVSLVYSSGEHAKEGADRINNHIGNIRRGQQGQQSIKAAYQPGNQEPRYYDRVNQETGEVTAGPYRMDKTDADRDNEVFAEWNSPIRAQVSEARRKALRARYKAEAGPDDPTNYLGGRPLVDRDRPYALPKPPSQRGPAGTGGHELFSPTGVQPLQDTRQVEKDPRSHVDLNATGVRPNFVDSQGNVLPWDERALEAYRDQVVGNSPAPTPSPDMTYNTPNPMIGGIYQYNEAGGLHYSPDDESEVGGQNPAPPQKVYNPRRYGMVRDETTLPDMWDVLDSYDNQFDQVNLTEQEAVDRVRELEKNPNYGGEGKAMQVRVIRGHNTPPDQAGETREGDFLPYSDESGYQHLLTGIEKTDTDTLRSTRAAVGRYPHGTEGQHLTSRILPHYPGVTRGESLERAQRMAEHLELQGHEGPIRVIDNTMEEGSEGNKGIRDVLRAAGRGARAVGRGAGRVATRLGPEMVAGTVGGLVSGGPLGAFAGVAAANAVRTALDIRRDNAQYEAENEAEERRLASRTPEQVRQGQASLKTLRTKYKFGPQNVPGKVTIRRRYRGEGGGETLPGSEGEMPHVVQQETPYGTEDVREYHRDLTGVNASRAATRMAHNYADNQGLVVEDRRGEDFDRILRSPRHNSLKSLLAKYKADPKPPAPKPVMGMPVGTGGGSPTAPVHGTTANQQPANQDTDVMSNPAPAQSGGEKGIGDTIREFAKPIALGMAIGSAGTTTGAAAYQASRGRSANEIVASAAQGHVQGVLGGAMAGAAYGTGRRRGREESEEEQQPTQQRKQGRKTLRERYKNVSTQ